MTPQDVLDYWFADAATAKAEDLKSHFQRWFQGGKEIDKEIKNKFGKAVKLAASDDLTTWENSTEGTLALIILLDQFTRNVFRGTEKAFAYDAKALRLSQKLIETGEDLYSLPLAASDQGVLTVADLAGVHLSCGNQPIVTGDGLKD